MEVLEPSRCVPEHLPQSLQETHKPQARGSPRAQLQHALTVAQFCTSPAFPAVQTARKIPPLPALLNSQGWFQLCSEPRRTRRCSWPGYHKREAPGCQGLPAAPASRGLVPVPRPKQLLAACSETNNNPQLGLKWVRSLSVPGLAQPLLPKPRSPGLQ